MVKDAKPGEIRFVDVGRHTNVLYNRLARTSSTTCYIYDPTGYADDGLYMVLASDTRVAENGVGRPAFVLWLTSQTYHSGWTWDSVLPRK